MKRKLGAMLLALCLMAGMTATAFAQGSNRTGGRAACAAGNDGGN